MNNTIAIDIYIIWTIAMPCALLACVLWLLERVKEQRKELTDVRESLGRRIVNSRDEIFEQINQLTSDIEFIDNEQEEMRGNIDILNDRLSLVETAFTVEEEPADIFDEEEYNRKLHEVIDSIGELMNDKKIFDEEESDGD